MDEGDLAWLGFKVVYDGAAAQGNVDNEVTKKYGEQGSADRELLVFFCNDAKEIVASRELFAPRYLPGEGRHPRPLDAQRSVRRSHLGQRAVLREGARLAAWSVRCCRGGGAAGRPRGLPCGGRRLRPGVLERGTFPALPSASCCMGATSTSWLTCRGVPEDYVCVLTRGHMFDPESCVWALQNGVHYVGMMGCAGKNSTVHDLVINAGISESDWDRVKRPIGLKLRREDPGGAGHRHCRPSWWTCATSSATAKRLAGPPREEPGAGIAALACACAADGKAVGKRGALFRRRLLP